MRWIIEGVKCNFQPHRVDHAWPTSHPRRGSLSAAYRGWSRAGCDGGDAKGGRLGMVHRTIRFLHCCGQHWWIVGERLSVCVRVYQHLSCLLLRCAGCWLTALPRLLHISQLRANLERKQKPTHRCCRPNPYYYSTPPLYIYKSLFLQSLLVIFSASHCLTLPLTSPPLSIHLFGRDMGWIIAEQDINTLDQKSLDLHQHMLPFFTSCDSVHFHPQFTALLLQGLD